MVFRNKNTQTIVIGRKVEECSPKIPYNIPALLLNEKILTQYKTIVSIRNPAKNQV